MAFWFGIVLLKGALLLETIGVPRARPTLDIDLLRQGKADPATLIALIQDCAHPRPSDGVISMCVIGTIRRECLDSLISLSESHLRFILKSWIAHYNVGRPHMALGPGDPPVITKAIPEPSSRHRRGDSYAVRAASVLGGLHHE